MRFCNTNYMMRAEAQDEFFCLHAPRSGVAEEVSDVVILQTILFALLARRGSIWL